MKIYIDYLGYRDSIKEFEEIKWFLNQREKNLSKRRITSFWLDFRKNYFDRLLDNQSYEMVDFIQQKLTNQQIKNRERWKKKQKENAIKQMDYFIKIHDKRKVMKDLVKLICYN